MRSFTISSRHVALVRCLAIVLSVAVQSRVSAQKRSDGASPKPAGWSQWRGPDRNGISSETGLARSWPEEGPPIVWQIKGLGKGYASVSVAGGRVFTLGRRREGETLIALDGRVGQGASGKELWATRFGDGDHSNGTPTVDGKRVYAIGLAGDLVCADVETGKVLWKKNFKRDFRGRMMSDWGYSESPLVDGDRLVCTPGGQDAAIVALDKLTGKTLWQTRLPDESGQRGRDGAGYSSIVVSEAAGVKQYVQLMGRGVIGVAAADGKLLWTYNRIANGTANIPTPIVRGDYVFCSSGYGSGAALLKIKRDGEQCSAEEVYFLDAKTMQNHHGGMILIGDYVYCGHGHNNGFPLCIEMMTGRDAWRHGRGAGSGSAAITCADGHLYFRYESGVMALVEATPKQYVLKGSFKIASRHGASWPHPVVAGGRLYLRDQDELHCYDVKKR
jgi:outer membrane protein assembly factor BamB